MLYGFYQLENVLISLPRNTNILFAVDLSITIFPHTTCASSVNMPPKYEQYESLVDGYEKHPDQGLKATKKKLNKDPNNIVLLVGCCRLPGFCFQTYLFL